MFIMACSRPRCREKREKIKNLFSQKIFIAHPDIIILYSCTVYTPHQTKNKADDDSIPTGLSMVDKQKSNTDNRQYNNNSNKNNRE